MSEPKRITEAELMAWRNRLARVYMDDRPPASLSSIDQVRLVVEVRQLRALIGSLTAASINEPGVYNMVVFPDLVAEAEEIRKERA